MEPGQTARGMHEPSGPRDLTQDIWVTHAEFTVRDPMGSEFTLRLLPKTDGGGSVIRSVDSVCEQLRSLADSLKGNR